MQILIALILSLRTKRSNLVNPQLTGVALKEEFIGAKISGIKGEGKSVTKVSYFKGNDPSKWKSNISTYELVNLGEIYEGIELKLKAHAIPHGFLMESHPHGVKSHPHGVKSFKLTSLVNDKDLTPQTCLTPQT